MNKRLKIQGSAMDRLQKNGTIAVLLIVWVVISENGWVNNLFLPSPTDLWKSLIDMAPMLPGAIGTSLYMILVGFLIGAVFGVLSSFIMAYSKVCLNMFGAIFDFMRPIPMFALIPMFILWFGIGRAPQIALIALGTSVTMGVTTSEAIRNIPNIYIQAAYTLGATRGQIFRTIVLPYVVPHLIGAIRLAAASSFGLDVAAEFMGSQKGLGYIMIVQQQYLRTSGILVVIIIYSCFAIIFDKIIATIEKRVTAWTDRSSKTNALLS